METSKDSVNKETIIKESIRLFAVKGYDAVSIQEICEVSGITKPTLYYYFKSKQGLLKTITETKGQQLVSITEESLIYSHDFIKSLTLVLTNTCRYAIDNPDYFRLHLNLLSAPNNSDSFIIYTSIKNKISDIYREFFIRSCTEFGNMRGKEELYSLLYQSNVNQCILSHLNNTLILNDQNIYQIIHSFIYGVAN